MPAAAAVHVQRHDLLVHQSAARTLLPKLARSLSAANVEIRGCSKTCQLIPDAKPASEQDYGKEFLDLILAVKIVKTWMCDGTIACTDRITEAS